MLVSPGMAAKEHTMFDTEAAAQAALDEAGAVLGVAITLEAKLSRAPTTGSRSLGWAQGRTGTGDHVALVTIVAWPEGFSVWTSRLFHDDGPGSGVHPTIADAARSLVAA